MKKIEQIVTMSLTAGIAFVSLGVAVAGCMGEGAEPPAPEQVGVAGEAEASRYQEEGRLSELEVTEVTQGQAVAASRYCETSADCTASCGCLNHQCVPGFSPYAACSQPPPLACTSNAECRTGCTCTADTCQYHGFSPPPVDCNLPPKAVVPISGTWLDASRPGTYFNVSNTSNGDVLIYWYTFLSSGAPVWYYAVLAAPSGSYAFTGQLISAKVVSGTSQPFAVGSLTLNTGTVGTGLLSWSFTNGGGTGSAAIDYAIRGNGTGTAANLSGEWYPPTQSGWGVSFDTQGTSLLAELGVYDMAGNAVWVEGSTTWSAASQSYTVALEEYKGLGLCPACTGPQSVTGTALGSMQIKSISASPCSALVTVDLGAPLSQWNRSNLTFSCLSH